MTGEVPPPMPARVSPWSVYDVFTLADGAQLFIAAVSDRQFVTLCRVLERADLAEDPAFRTNALRVAARPRLLEQLTGILAHHRIDELSAKLDAAGLPYAPILRPDQLLDDPHLRQSGAIASMQTDDGTTTDVVLLPLTLGGRRPQVRTRLARAGEHTEEVLARTRSSRPRDPAS